MSGQEASSFINSYRATRISSFMHTVLKIPKRSSAEPSVLSVTITFYVQKTFR